MPLLWVSIAFLTGLLTGEWLTISWVCWAILAVFFLALSVFDSALSGKLRYWFALRRRMPVSVGVILLIFALGGFRSWWAHHPFFTENDLAWYNDKGNFVLTGWVSAPPDQRDEMTVYQIKMIEIENPFNSDWVHRARKITGLAQVRMSATSTWQYGDLLQFTAQPKQPSERTDFSYRKYLAAFNIHTVIYSPRSVLKVGSGYGTVFRTWLILVREKARHVIFATYPQPEAGLLAGILLGMDNDLPESLAQAYRDTGTSHIIAISGYNMGLLAALFLFLFNRLSGPYWAALIMGVCLVIYTLFVDASASVMRALIMAVVGAGGHLLGRRQIGLNALAFTAAIMCCINPLLIHDISFQLSFAATFGLVVFAQPMQNWLSSILEKRLSEKQASKWSGPISEYFLFTLAAQFTTLPVIAAHFGRISISALLANPLVLPAQPPVLVLGAATTLVGLLHPLAGKIMMLFSWPFLKYTNLVVTLMARLKGGALILHPVFATVFLIFCLIFLLIFFARVQLSKFLRSRTFFWFVFLLVCACATIFSIIVHRADGQFHLRMIPCGGEITLAVQSPEGGMVLIDPHGDMDELTAALEKTLSPWSFHLDGVLLTDRNSSAALADLSEQIAIHQVFLAPATYRQGKDSTPLIIPDELLYQKMQSSQKANLGEEIALSLVSEDLRGTALLIEYGNLRVLIPNGVDYAVIKADAPDSLKSLTALVLGEEDVSYIPLRVWNQLNPGTILWKSPSISPFDDADTFLHLVSDGSTAWMVRN